MSGDDSSDLSSVDSLSPPPSGDDCDVQLTQQDGILKFFHKVPKQTAAAAPKCASPAPAPKRAPSPPHEYVLADNPDIAFIVMFRAKFNDVFPKNLTTFGPQELEREIVDSVPGERVELFLCSILKLLLNRQQDVKPGHYNRALEDAIKTHESSWPRSWGGTNPLAGGATFASMTPVQRLDLLRALILWTMQYCKSVKDVIDNAYKNKRQEDDLNQPLAVQPLGSDSDKRRYFLVEGPEHTSFRIYRESNPAGFQRTWWSVAGSIEDVHALSNKLLSADGGPKARRLSQKLQEQIPHFEESLEKLRRREYRLQRKQQFKRPEPGFSLYEGRTRGKRAKYTYDDDDYEFNSDSTATRRSARNTGPRTSAEPTGPVTTASGRQVRAPTRLTAETMSSNGGVPSADNSVHDGEDSEMRDDGAYTSVGRREGRPLRSAAVNHGRSGWASTSKRKGRGNADEYDSDAEDEDSEPDFGDDEDGDEHVPDESEDEVEEEFEEDDADMVDNDDDLPSPSSLIVKIPIKAVLDGSTGKYSKATGGNSDQPKPEAVLLASPSGSSERSVGRLGGGTPVRQVPRATFGSPAQTEEEISVAVKRVTPETESDVKANPSDQKPPLNPQANNTTSLAFRGSPEKPQHALTPVDI